MCCECVVVFFSFFRFQLLHFEVYFCACLMRSSTNSKNRSNISTATSTSSKSHSPKARFYRFFFFVQCFSFDLCFFCSFPSSSEKKKNIVKAFMAYEIILMYKQCCRGPIDLYILLISFLFYSLCSI